MGQARVGIRSVKNRYAEVAETLKTRLVELSAHVHKIDGELNKALPSDSEEQAAERFLANLHRSR
jgi:hypothetical protein